MTRRCHRRLWENVSQGAGSLFCVLFASRACSSLIFFAALHTLNACAFCFLSCACPMADWGRPRSPSDLHVVENVGQMAQETSPERFRPGRLILQYEVRRLREDTQTSSTKDWKVCFGTANFGSSLGNPGSGVPKIAPRCCCCCCLE